MALIIAPTLKSMTLGAGEPLFFGYQPCSTAGVAESLTGRAFVLSIFTDGAAIPLGYYNATVSDGSDPVALWRLDGTVSENLRGKSGMKFEIAERLDNGRDIIATGDFNVTPTAPTVVDNDAAAQSRYMVRITRKNDAETIDAPSFSVKITAFNTAAILPAFTTAPSITGSSTVGGTLTATDGVATASITARQWLLNSTAISGATGLTYVTTTAGAYTYRATATNSTGATSATSAAFNVAAAVVAPVNSAAPVISGTATTGQTLSATTGTWSNSPTSYAYQWLRAGASISGATAATYVLVTADEGTAITCRVTATNAGGSASATSNTMTIAVTPAPYVSISAAQTQMEGNTGTSAYAFTLTLARNGSTAAYPYTWTVAGSGTNPADATDFGGTFPTGSGTFAAGETSKTITVLVSGDTTVEPDETFTLTVSTTGLNTVSVANTITNDDTATATTAQQMIGNRGSWMYSPRAAVTAANNLQLTRFVDKIGAGGTAGSVATDIAITLSTYYSADVQGPGYIARADCEFNGICVPFTWGGATSKTLVAGDNDVVCDPLYPSAFGMTSFPQGTAFAIKIEREFAVGAVPPDCGSNGSQNGDATYRAAAGTASQIGKAGPLVAQTGYTFAYIGFYPVAIIGRVKGMIPAYASFGASIEAGTNDSGPGYCGRASMAGQQVAYSRLALGSETGINFAALNSKRIVFAKYANIASNGYGGNDFSGAKPKESIATALAQINAQIKAMGVKRILQMRLSPKANTTDSFATVENQTPRANFLDTRAYVDAQAALDPNVNALVDMSSVMEPASKPGAWVVNGTANYATLDGTHPESAIHVLMATVLRPVIDAQITALAPTYEASRFWLSGGGTTNSAGSIFQGESATLNVGTIQHVFELEGEFTEIQLILANQDSTDTQDYLGASMVAGTDMSDKFANSLFSDASQVKTFAFGQNGNPIITVPARVNQNNQLALSDWMPITAKQRTDSATASAASKRSDGSLPFLLYVRLAIPIFKSDGVTNRRATYINRTGADWATGRGQLWASSDVAAAPILTGAWNSAKTFSSSNEGFINYAILAGVRYKSKGKIMTVMAGGSSFTSGGSDNLKSHTGVQRGFQDASTAAAPVESVNYGMATNTADNASIGMIYALPIIKPTHVCWEYANPNSVGSWGSTQTSADGIESNLELRRQQVFTAAQNVGAVPFVVNGTPRNTDATTSYFTAAQDGYRLAALARLNGRGFAVADINAAVQDGTSPQRLKRTENGFAVDETGDFLHPNTAGYLKWATAVTPVINTLKTDFLK